MKAIVVETHIDADPDAVFAYMRDYSHQAVWQAEGVVEVRSEPAGPSRVGTLVHKVRRTPMGTLSFTEEVVELDEGERRWVELTRSGGIKGTRLEWQVLDEGEGSRVRLSAEMHGTGLNRLMLPVIRRQATAGWTSEGQELKRILESA